MNATHFSSFARSLFPLASSRRALAAFAATSLGLLGVPGPGEDTRAHDPLKACKKKSGKKKA